MSLLHMDRKPYRGSSGAIRLTFSNLEMSDSRLIIFQSVIFRKGLQLGYMLLLHTNSKSYMGSAIAPSDLTLKGQIQGYPDFKVLQYIVQNEPIKLGLLLLLKNNRKSFMGSPNGTIAFYLR